MSKLQVLFWIDSFVHLNGNFKEKNNSVIVSLLKKIIFEEELPDFCMLSISIDTISEMDRLLMANNLK